MSQSTTITVVDLSTHVTDDQKGQVLSWLHDLANDLRSEDLDEIAASSGEDPLTALIASVFASETGFIILHDDKPVCVFGAQPVAGMEADAGIAWMLGSPTMDKPSVARAILRQTADYVARLHARFPLLWNWVDARNTKSRAWLRWAGFSIISADPSHGLESRLFYQFARKEARHV
ncbi:MAG: hypothetical protein ACK4UQ_06605 [Brevundimonas sp.]